MNLGVFKEKKMWKMDKMFQDIKWLQNFLYHCQTEWYNVWPTIFIFHQLLSAQSFATKPLPSHHSEDVTCYNSSTSIWDSSWFRTEIGSYIGNAITSLAKTNIHTLETKMSEKTMLLEDILLKAKNLNWSPGCIQQPTGLS